MEFDQLSSPVPRGVPIPNSRVAIPVTGEPSYLPIPEFDESVPFIKVVKRRATKRTFGPLTIEQLSALLWIVGKTIRIEDRLGYAWQHRYPPSAGGIHPVSLFVMSPLFPAIPIGYYCPASHALRTPTDTPDGHAFEVRCRVEEVLPIGTGTVVLLAADFEATMAVYEHGESLVWRDVGVLYAYAALAAEFLGLALCGLGATVSPIPGTAGTGGFVVGG